MKKIGIIGSGFVGQNTGKHFYKHGYDIYFYDISDKNINNLIDEGYNASTHIDEIADSDIFFSFRTDTDRI